MWLGTPSKFRNGLKRETTKAVKQKGPLMQAGDKKREAIMKMKHMGRVCFIWGDGKEVQDTQDIAQESRQPQSLSTKAFLRKTRGTDGL